MAPAPVSLPGEAHGQGSLVGYSSRVRKESDTTELLNFHFPLWPTQRPGKVGQRLLCAEQSAGLGLSRWEPGQAATETTGPLSPGLSLSLTLVKPMVD